MTGVTSTAGSVPTRGDAPGSLLPVLSDLPAFRSAVEERCAMPRSGRPLKGLALRAADEGDAAGFEIAILDRDERAFLALGPFQDEEVIAVWRALGASSGLPLMIEKPDGSRETPYPQIGRLQLGAVRIRRRHGLLNGRRPRFLVRRKTGRLPLRPNVFREREIAGGAA